MIDLSNGIFGQLIRGHLERGSVIKTIIQPIDDPHFFVPLSNNIDVDPLCFFVATSQTSYYDRTPGLEAEIVRIAAGRFDFFPKPTIIKCHEIIRSPKTRLVDNFRNKSLIHVGVLPSEIMGMIDNIIVQSRRFSPNEKRLISNI